VGGHLRADAVFRQVQATKLFEFVRQAVTQRAFGAELFQQLFREFESGRLELTSLEHLTPASRYLLLG
jgi:hypothetical protein